MDKYTRYLRIVHWARRRYTANGSLLHAVGGVPAPAARIEQMAFQRILNTQ